MRKVFAVFAEKDKKDNPGSVPVVQANQQELKPRKQVSVVDASEGQRENMLMKVFGDINPALNYGSPFERRACKALIDKYSAQEAIRMAKMVVSVQGEEYAPIVVSPQDMWKKLPKIIIYFKRREGDVNAGKSVEL